MRRHPRRYTRRRSSTKPTRQMACCPTRGVGRLTGADFEELDPSEENTSQFVFVVLRRYTTQWEESEKTRTNESCPTSPLLSFDLNQTLLARGIPKPRRVSNSTPNVHTPRPCTGQTAAPIRPIRCLCVGPASNHPIL